MTYVLPNPGPEHCAEVVAKLAAHEWFAGPPGKEPRVTTNDVIRWLDNYVGNTDEDYRTFAALPPDRQRTTGEDFATKQSFSYVFVMAIAKAALEHQDTVIAASGDKVEKARKQTLVTAIAAAQNCFRGHAYGPFPKAEPSHH